MSSFDSGGRSVLFAVVLAVVLIVLWALRDIAILVALSVLLAFVLAPAVGLLQRIPLPRGARMPRGAASAIVVLALVFLAGWVLSMGVPVLVSELARLAQGIPGNFQMLLTEADRLGRERGLTEYVTPVVTNLRENATGHLQTLGTAVARWAGRVFGNVGQIVRLALLPVLTFYLLAESEAVRDSMLRFLPVEWRQRMSVVQSAVDRALRSYVRGQTIVCLTMGTVVGTSLWLAGYPGASVLGVLVGLAEIIPFLGFWAAMTAIVITAFGTSPSLALTGFAIYAVINTLNGYLFLPRVMGRHLKMHPFVIIISVLAGATLLGPVGVFIALPGAAVIQALIEELARPVDEAKSGA